MRTSAISLRLHLIERHYRRGAWRQMAFNRRLLVGRVEAALADEAMGMLLAHECHWLLTIRSDVLGVRA